MSILLLDKLPPAPEYSVPESSALALEAIRSPHLSASPLTRSLNAFIGRFDASLLALLDADVFDILREDAAGMLTLLHSDIKYEQCSSTCAGTIRTEADAEAAERLRTMNEKRQGRALFERQQRFAALVRKAARMGLQATRARHIDAETLTQETLADTYALECLPQEVSTFYR